MFRLDSEDHVIDIEIDSRPGSWEMKMGVWSRESGKYCEVVLRRDEAFSLRDMLVRLLGS